MNRFSHGTASTHKNLSSRDQKQLFPSSNIQMSTHGNNSGGMAIKVNDMQADLSSN